MIFNLRFGYAGRHHIYYDTTLKRGNIKLWSSYSGSAIGADPTVNDDSFLSELAARDTLRKAFFGINRHTEFSITGEKDILSVLASLVAIKEGGEYSFTSKEGRKIALALGKEGKWEKEIITVNIQYGKAGKLTIEEADKLIVIARDIFHNLGYSDQEIAKILERITEELSD
jgi:hypothetical protein